jgi:hypothetical protein
MHADKAECDEIFQVLAYAKIDSPVTHGSPTNNISHTPVW